MSRQITCCARDGGGTAAVEEMRIVVRQGGCVMGIQIAGFLGGECYFADGVRAGGVGFLMRRG